MCVCGLSVLASAFADAFARVRVIVYLDVARQDSLPHVFLVEDWSTAMDYRDYLRLDNEIRESSTTIRLRDICQSLIQAED